MFDKNKLENKAMTHKTIFVKNNGNATINGLPAGKSMPLKATASGKPLDQHWRRLTRRQSDKTVLQLSDNDPNRVVAPAKEHVKTAKAKTPAKAKATKTKSTNKGD